MSRRRSATHRPRGGDKGSAAATPGVDISIQAPPFASAVAGLTEAAVLAATVAAPIFFNPETERVFEPEKLSLLVVAAALALPGVAAAVVAAARRALAGGGPFANAPAPSKSDADDNAIPRTAPTDVGAEAGHGVFARPGRAVLVAVAFAMGAVLLGGLASPLPGLALWGSYRRVQGLVAYAAYAVLFCAAAISLRTSGARARWRRALLVGAVPVAAYALLQRVGFDVVPWTEVAAGPIARAFGPMGNAIFLGAYAAFVLPVAVAEFLARRAEPLARISAWTIAGIVGLLLLALVASGSQGPWLAAPASLWIALVLWLALRRRRGAALALAGLGCMAALAAGGVAAAARPDSTGRLGALSSRVWQSRTARERLLVWDLMADVAGSSGRHALVGYGPDTLAQVLSPRLTPEIVRLTPGQIYDRTHNVVWEWWVTGGVLAVLAWIGLYVGAVAAALRLLGLSGPGGLAGLAAAGFGGAGVGALAAAFVRPGLAGPAVAAGTLCAGVVFVALSRPTTDTRRRPPERDQDATGGLFRRGPDGLGAADALVVVGLLAALGGHVVEGAFGLPSVPLEALFWLALGYLAALGLGLGSGDEESGPTDAGGMRQGGGLLSAGLSDGLVDGIALATVAFAPILAPSARPGPSPVWLLIPLTWLMADGIGPSARATDRGSAVGSSVVGSIVGRLSPIALLAVAMAVAPSFGPGAAYLGYVLVFIGAVALLGSLLAPPQDAVGTPVPATAGADTSGSRRGGASNPRRDLGPVGRVSGLGLLLPAIFAAWHFAVAPVAADASMHAALGAAAGGDMAGVLANIASARSLWPGQPAFDVFEAAAQRDIMENPETSPNERERAYAAGVAALQASLSKLPSADTLDKLGNLHTDRGDLAPSGPLRQRTWHAAEAAYEEALRLQPVDPAVQRDRGLVLERLGDLDGAASAYTSALDLDPGLAVARAGVVRVRVGQDRLDEALAAAREGVRLDAARFKDAIDAAADTPVDPVAAESAGILFLVADGQGDEAANRIETLRRAGASVMADRLAPLLASP